MNTTLFFERLDSHIMSQSIGNCCRFAVYFRMMAHAAFSGAGGQSMRRLVYHPCVVRTMDGLSCDL